MSAPPMFSRPTYEALAVDPAGRRHLFVADHRFEPSPETFAGLPADASVEIWRTLAEARVAAAPHEGGGAVLRDFRSRAQILDALDHRLSRERVGLRLYAVGLESFIWDVAKIAADKGLDRDEYRLFHVGSQSRRVYCVHCRAVTENVSTNIATCSGCGAHLFVRDHFSRRLAAFAGVQVDAEVPGEIPAIEEVYP
ncbi:dimethylamine monooxygenase subunit DmmA family protein [Methylocella sp.]|uniref:dimethylamine monooxygenase subunit DmmA family protein n=1 Tax=Methylocella sp. TaxID=1978226 RepID=UPI003784CD19